MIKIVKRGTTLLWLFLLLSISTSLSAGTRDGLFYQGLLFDPNGSPIEGTLPMTFRIYTSSTGGTPLWEETQSIALSEGIFTAELGGTTTFPVALFDEETLYLGIQIAGESELSPRSALFSVPFAQQCEEAITAKSLANNIVTSQSMTPGAILSAHMAAGAVGSRELSSTGVTAGTYTLATVTVDASGRITSAASGVLAPSSGGTITGVIAGTGLTGGGLGGTVGLSVATGGIGNAQLADGSVTTTKLGAGAVGLNALGANSVDTTKIVDGTITGADVSSSTSLTLQGLVLKAFGTSSGQTSEARFQELDANGSNYIGFKGQDSIPANLIWTLPNKDGAAGEFLATDGTGVLSWATGASGTITEVIAGTGLIGGGTAGSVTLDVDASTIVTGTLPDAQLSGNVSLLGSSIESSEITDDSIMDADISPLASIANSKLAAIESANMVHGASLYRLDVISSSAGVIPAENTPLGASIDSSEIDDGTITSTDLSATAGITDNQVDNNLTIISGTIDDTVIGGNSPSVGTFQQVNINGPYDRGIVFNPYGTNPGQTSEMDFLELAANGSNYVAFKAPDSIADNVIWTLPDSDGTSGQVLSTNGGGLLSWSTAGSGTITGVTAGTGLTGGGTSGNVTLNVDAASLTGLNASNLASGTVSDARLSANVSLLGSSIEASEITDGTIANADINASAAIADTKLATISTAGKVSDSALSSSVSLVGQTIESSEITDGTIVNADIGSAAAIAGSKVSPDFGSQNVTTTGDLSAAGGFKIMVGPFQENNVAANVTKEWDVASEGSNVTRLRMPWAGSIMGISVNCSASVTAQSLTMNPTVNGTAKSLGAVVSSGSASASGTQAKDTETFAAGDAIGCQATTPSGYTPTTAECVCAVFVEM